MQNSRTNWGDRCNVEAGFGIRPTTDTNSTLVDSIIWAKPGRPTIDGASAPPAGQWWEAYAEELVINADPPLDPTY